MIDILELLTFVWREGSTAAMSPFTYQLPSGAINYGNYLIGGSTLRVPWTGIFYFSYSVGVPGNTQVDYSLETPAARRINRIGLVRRHTSSTGIDTMSRDALIPLTAQDQVTMISTKATYSTSQGKYTSFTAFDITSIMQTGTHYFMVSKTSGSTSSGKIAFDKTISSSRNSGWDNNTSVYVCPNDGIYVFSLSVLLTGRMAAHVDLIGPMNTYELRRTHNNHAGEDTLSRTVLCTCVTGQSVEVRVQAGTVFGNTGYSTSFMGFWYNPDSTRTASRAWFLSRFTQRDASTSNNDSPLTYSRNLIALNMGNIRQFGIEKIICPADGTYFVHITVETKPNIPVDVYVRRRRGNGLQTLFAGIKRSSAWHTGGADTLSRSMLIGCNQGDILDVQIKSGSAIGSGSTETKVANAFLGFQVCNLVTEDIFMGPTK